MDNHENVPPFDYNTYHGLNENKEDKDISDDKSDDKSDDEMNVLLYEKFVNNGMKVDNLGLLYENEIILKSSYANILFTYPVYRDSVVFTLTANNDVEGFTMKELVLKVMQRYHLLTFLCVNYNMAEGKIVNTEAETDNVPMKHLFTNVPKSDRDCFEPTLYTSEWTDNGVVQLKYHKDKDQWEVMLYDYI